jgi:GR25 family glycosyltransferase involved in LPS biosynthesis
VKTNKIAIYIINLKRDKEKYSHMKRLCARFGLAVEFIEAVYGKELSENEIAACYSKEDAMASIGRELSN